MGLLLVLRGDKHLGKIESGEDNEISMYGFKASMTLRLQSTVCNPVDSVGSE